MANYKRFQKEDSESFMRLYEIYLQGKLDFMKQIFDRLPTDVIERIFDGTDIYKKEDELFISFGYNHIERLAREMEEYHKLMMDDRLVEFLSNFGHKVNMNKFGVREK